MSWQGYELAVSDLIGRLDVATEDEMRALHAEADALLERFIREMATHSQPEATALVQLLDDGRLYDDVDDQTL